MFYRTNKTLVQVRVRMNLITSAILTVNFHKMYAGGKSNIHILSYK